MLLNAGDDDDDVSVSFAFKHDSLGYLHQGPCDDAWSSVVEKFEVEDVPESWVEFDAHVQIINEGTCQI